MSVSGFYEVGKWPADSTGTGFPKGDSCWRSNLPASLTCLPVRTSGTPGPQPAASQNILQPRDS